MLWPNIQIEILRATRHTSAHLHHVCAADQEWDIGSMQCCHRSAMKLISFTFTVDSSNWRRCACSHYSSITHWNRRTRAWPTLMLTRSVHPYRPFRFLKRWQKERCVSLPPQTFTTLGIRAEKCTMRLPRFLVMQTSCYSAVISQSTDCPKKRRNSPQTFAAR